MRKHLAKIALLLVFCMCLPVFASCDMSQLMGYQQPVVNEGGGNGDKNDSDDKKEPEETYSEDLPEGLILALNSDNNSYRVTEYKGSAEDLVIPAKHNGFPVTAIDDNVFSSNKTLVSVTIPDTVVTIGNSSFKGCHNLKNVYIGEYRSDLMEIGKQAFFGCYLLEEIFYVGYEED